MAKEDHPTSSDDYNYYMRGLREPLKLHSPGFFWLWQLANKGGTVVSAQRSIFACLKSQSPVGFFIMYKYNVATNKRQGPKRILHTILYVFFST